MQKLPVTRITQRTNVSCGAACAQMILVSIKAARVTQKKLYRKIHSFRGEDPVGLWFSSPDGLVDILNVNRNPTNFRDNFRLYRERNPMKITVRMVNTIRKFSVACITLIHDDTHWVVMHGYRTNQDIWKSARVTPSNPLDLREIWIQNPSKTRDQIQGNVDIDQWVQKVGRVANGGAFDGRYLAICDPPGKKKEKEFKEREGSGGSQ